MARQRHIFWVNPTLSHPLLSLSSSPRLAIATLLWFVWTLTFEPHCSLWFSYADTTSERAAHSCVIGSFWLHPCSLPSSTFFYLYLYSHFWALPMHMFIDYNFPFNREHSQFLTLFFVILSNEQFPPSHSLCTHQPLEQLLVWCNLLPIISPQCSKDLPALLVFGICFVLRAAAPFTWDARAIRRLGGPIPYAIALPTT